jgi:hypothetical protein
MFKLAAALATTVVLCAACTAGGGAGTSADAPESGPVARVSCSDARTAVNAIVDEVNTAIQRGEMPQGIKGAKLGDAMALVLERPDCFSQENEQAAQDMLDAIDRASN